MVIYFNNDGTYKQEAVNAPVLVDDKPIGFISEVNEERVTCYLWDRYVREVKCFNYNNPLEPEFSSISITTSN